VSEGLAQGPYVAARAGLEPATYLCMSEFYVDVPSHLLVNETSKTYVQSNCYIVILL